MHPSAPLLGKPLFHNLHIVHAALQEDLSRQIRSSCVKLFYKGTHEFFICCLLILGHMKMLSAQEFAVSDKKYGDHCVLLFFGKCDNIPVFKSIAVDLLTVSDFADAL